MRTALPLLMLLSTGVPLMAQDAPLFTLEQYLLDFDYGERRDMKIGSKELVKLLKEKKAVLVDAPFTRADAHRAGRQHICGPPLVRDRDAGENPVRLPRQAAQDGEGIIAIERLADDFAGELERGVGRQHRVQQQAPFEQEIDAMRRLGARHPLDVNLGCFAGMRAFIDLRIRAQAGTEDQGVEGDAHLVQQLTAARTTRSEIEAHHPSR